MVLAVLLAALAGCIPSTIGAVAAGGGGGGGGSAETGASSPPALETLSLSVGELVPAFDPATTSYSASVDFLTTRISVTATTGGSNTIRVAGDAVANGQTSQPVALLAPIQTIGVTVENGSLSTTYLVNVQRTTLTGFIQREPAIRAQVAGQLDVFGWKVAIDGDTMAVGAPFEDGTGQGSAGDPSDLSAATADSGAVHVFRRSSPTSAWTLEAYLKAPNNLPGAVDGGDTFGHTLALGGDTLVVGAPNEDSAAAGPGTPASDDDASAAGAVYVFRRTGSTWTPEAYLKASNPDSSDLFGYSVALQQDRLVVGAPQEDNTDGSQNNDPAGSDVNAGAAYVFERNGADWVQTAYLKAATPSPAGAAFGESVDIDADTIAVSAPNEDAGSGAVYVFDRSGTDWLRSARLRATQPDAGDFFGRALDLRGGRIAAGAATEDGSAAGVGGDSSNDSLFDAGAAYVFRREGSNWVEEAYVKATNPAASADFGFSVALHDEMLAVGAPKEDGGFAGVTAAANTSVQVSGVPDSGAVYLYSLVGGAWQPTAYIKAATNALGLQFGSTLALDERSLLVGGPLESGIVLGNGAVFHFR
ncbi:MAG: cadherin-like beta sandwich domain-containing protein [Planctomycetes bacterium]|nr:cadherin-like beta sandwich domain-containing protein [Planctomycetota bacterium]